MAAFLVHGKIIAATNRDLGEGMHSGRFRQDFYYRLCSDVVVTLSLREQLRESPDVLRELLTFITRRMAGEGAESLADEVETWILAHLGVDYPWPGNIRDLEQCVRNVLIRKEYHPHLPPSRHEYTSRMVLADSSLAERRSGLVRGFAGKLQQLLVQLPSHEEPLVVEFIEEWSDAVEKAVSLRCEKNAQGAYHRDVECVSQTPGGPIVQDDTGAKLQTQAQGLSLAATQPRRGDHIRLRITKRLYA